MRFKPCYLLATLACIPCLAIADPAPVAAPTHAAFHERGSANEPGLPPPRDERGGRPFGAALLGLPQPMWLGDIQLSEAQEDQLFKVLYAQLPTLHEQEKTLRHAHEELRALPFVDKYDAARVKTLTESIGRALATLELTKATTENRIFALLTPEQRKQVQEHLSRQPHPEEQSGHGPDGARPSMDNPQDRQDKPMMPR